jgi:hypothetical protein
MPEKHHGRAHGQYNDFVIMVAKCSTVIYIMMHDGAMGGEHIVNALGVLNFRWCLKMFFFVKDMVIF